MNQMFYLFFALIMIHEFQSKALAQEPQIEVVKSRRPGEKNFKLITWSGTTPVTLKAFHKVVVYPFKGVVKGKKIITSKVVETYSIHFKCYRKNGIVHDYTFNNDGFINLLSAEKSKSILDDEIGRGSMGAAFVPKKKSWHPEPIYLKDQKGNIRQDEFHLRLDDDNRLIVDGQTGCVNWEKSYKENLIKIKAKEIDDRLVVENYPGTYIVFDRVRGDVLNTRGAQASFFFEDDLTPCRVPSNSFRGKDFNEDLSPENILRVKKLCDDIERKKNSIHAESSIKASEPKKTSEPKAKNEVVIEGIQITEDLLQTRVQSKTSKLKQPTGKAFQSLK